MELEIPEHILKKLKKLSKQDRERIKRRLDDIDYKLSKLDMEPQKIIENRKET